MDQRAAPLLPAGRRAAIVKLAAQRGAVRAAELAARFDVNASTIRRDLRELERRGVLRRVHGGAVAVEGAEGALGAGPGLQEGRIGQAVAGMIEDGETIFLGPGELTLEVARCLGERSRLTVVTNSLDAAHWVACHTSHTLIVTGGQLEGRDRGLAGRLALEALADLRADHVILELGGVSAVGGLTDDSLSQAEVARALLKIGAEVVILVAADRVGREAAAYVAPVSEADVVVTTREASSAFLWDLSEVGVRILLA